MEQQINSITKYIPNVSIYFQEGKTTDTIIFSRSLMVDWWDVKDSPVCVIVINKIKEIRTYQVQIFIVASECPRVG